MWKRKLEEIAAGRREQGEHLCTQHSIAYIEHNKHKCVFYKHIINMTLTEPKYNLMPGYI